MRWDRLFEDLQDQFASEWEAERAALDTEAERLRVARLSFRQRLQALTAPSATIVTLDLGAAAGVRGTVTAVGEDWFGLDMDAAAAGVVRVDAVRGIGLAHADLLHSAHEQPAVRRSLAERMTLGFVLRDLARRRAAVTVYRTDGIALTGTIDRAGGDHLDLALHDAGAPRRASEVTGFRILPFTAVAWVRLAAADARSTT